eukprot:CAMPEP_0119070726 /NCGR_PEP_ID=MMETSP1178-20130426/42906_1 /TAXON_ID=33656 /ORGANISM="unid sp, Strain CCMP2000" /LENGTH=93 /DNA_ID=CAMNT_0007052589 /DNA_START=341 /DNA_END=622 /DNA_ORIENTATION=+
MGRSQPTRHQAMLSLALQTEGLPHNAAMLWTEAYPIDANRVVLAAFLAVLIESVLLCRASLFSWEPLVVRKRGGSYQRHKHSDTAADAEARRS